MAWHLTQAAILVDAGVEMLAFETFPAQKEAEAMVRMLRQLPSSRAWMSFSCKVCSWFHFVAYILRRFLHRVLQLNCMLPLIIHVGLI